MNWIKKLCDFFYQYFFLGKDNKSEKEESTDCLEKEEEPELDLSEETLKEAEAMVIDDKIKVVKMTLTRLYMLSQKITIFKESFPDKYYFFKGQIEELEKSYKDSLKSVQKDLTYEIDPEKDGEKLAKILKLEKEIEAFIEKEVKFDIITKKLQRLILKLNILYNVSITHTKVEEQKKVMIQTERAISLELKIVHEFKSYEYLLEDMRLKDEFIKLVSYLDYEIFKLSIRNSDIVPNEMLKRLAMLIEFDKFDYDAIFKAFLEEELTEIRNLIEQIREEDCSEILKRNYNEILTKIACSKEEEEILLNALLWAEIFQLESNIFEVLKEDGIENKNIRIKVLSKINISVNEKDVLVLPKASTYLALTNIFSKEQDDRLLLVMKLLKNVSNDITYREIYFLLVLFEVIDVVMNISSELSENMEKYLERYPYDNETIHRKKEQILYSTNREYVYVFTLGEYEQKLLEVLRKLNMDFKNVNDKIFLNKFYFSGLSTVINSLETITKNI